MTNKSESNPLEFTLGNLPTGVSIKGMRSKVRVLYLPLNARLGLQTATETAFVRNGFKLCSMDYLRTKRPNRTLLRLVEIYKPIWIHMQLQFTTIIRPETLEEIQGKYPNIQITNWTGDIRNEARSEFVDVSKFITKSLISSEGQLELYKDAGCENVEYWQIGVDAAKFRPMRKNIIKKLKKRYNHDIVFCANINTNFPGSDYRIEVTESLTNKFKKKFKIYGNKTWEKYNVNYVGPIEHRKQNWVYNTSKLVLNVNNFNNIPMYFSGRQLIAMASGKPVLSAYIPGLERYFKNHHHLIWFKSADECVELALYYLKRPREAEKIGNQGREEVLKNHTFDIRIKELSERLGLK